MAAPDTTYVIPAQAGIQNLEILLLRLSRQAEIWGPQPALAEAGAGVGVGTTF